VKRIDKSNIELRAISDADAEFLFGVYASTRADELAPIAWTDAQKHAFLRMQFDAQRKDYWSNYDTSRFQIVMCDGVDAGRLYVERRGDDLRIIDIALLPPFRNRGIGSFLLQQLFGEADDAVLDVRIHVEFNNPAQRLYARLGFAFAGDGDGVYRAMVRRPLLRQSVA
jgi:ribosomal protein S18 acetylase RimI-like enzyme